MYATMNFFKMCLNLILLFCILQEVKDANQAKWYKRMYDSLHRTGKDGELQFFFFDRLSAFNLEFKELHVIL